MTKKITPFKLKDAPKTDANLPVSGSLPTDEEIRTQIYRHLDSLPYAGGYPSDWHHTLAAHLGKWFRRGLGNDR